MGKTISPTVFRAAIKRALAEGEAKGRRLERRALMGLVNRGGVFVSNRLAEKYVSARTLLDWCAARSKRGKVGECR